tara:strand:+ start:49 stop:1182 length:1134 start_codon:yes stop_codon:yes gene_type:complete
VPSTEKIKSLDSKIIVGYNNREVVIDVYDTPLGKRFLEALADNLVENRILEKNFCFLGWASSTRDLNFLCNELNKAIEQINSFGFEPAYQRIDSFTVDDFQYSDKLKVGLGPEKQTPGLRLKHESCNLLHRYFEDLQGTAWQLSNYYKQADAETKYAIRQLNNICHEIESWVMSYRKSVIDPDWMRPSQITTFLNAPRYDLHENDFELFKINRYDRELGGVYLHWSQVGKTLVEVYRDEHAPHMDDALCSEINHQKYYSGEFDIEWGDTITEETHDFKKEEMDGYRAWLKENNYDYEDPNLSLGYIKLGQIDLNKNFGTHNFTKVYNLMKDNLNINKIQIVGKDITDNVFPYTLESDNWKQIQIKGLKRGYESRSLR